MCRRGREGLSVTRVAHPHELLSMCEPCEPCGAVRFRRYARARGVTRNGAGRTKGRGRTTWGPCDGNWRPTCTAHAARLTSEEKFNKKSCFSCYSRRPPWSVLRRSALGFVRRTPIARDSFILAYTLDKGGHCLTPMGVRRGSAAPPQGGRWGSAGGQASVVCPLGNRPGLCA